jgi:DNA topoisomerase-1
VELAGIDPDASVNIPQKNIVAAIDAVSKLLGNTRAICRACYVHPEILEAYLEGEVITTNLTMESGVIEFPFGEIELSPIEQAVLRLLKKRS